MKSCKISYHGQTTDLCLCRTLAKFDKKSNGDVVITANPVTVVLDDTEIKVQSIFTFQKGKGVLEVERKLLNDVEGVEFLEYITAGFGVNEYQPDLVGAKLIVDGQELDYAYQGRKLVGKDVAVANCPQVASRLEMRVEKGTVEAEEGIAFAPIYHLRARNIGGIKSWLKLAKAN